MNRRVSKLLKKRALRMSRESSSDLDSGITRRYKASSPVYIYRRLKKAWKLLPRNQRSLGKLIETINK
jgi:hypothetical protein